MGCYFYIKGFRIISKQYLKEKEDFIIFHNNKNNIYWSYNEAYADLCALIDKFEILKSKL